MSDNNFFKKTFFRKPITLRLFHKPAKDCTLTKKCKNYI